MLCWGIGGGGIYVTVLMIFGGLSPHDAVPLSKAIVFLGSLSALVLNLQRTFISENSPNPKTVIDLSICRLVVPASLAGTLFGVLLNRSIPDVALVGLLAVLLIGTACMVINTATRQYFEEQKLDFIPELDDELAVETSERPLPQKVDTRGQAFYIRRDALLGVIMLLVVVASGVVRYHAHACISEIQKLHGVGYTRHVACHHPALFFLIGEPLQAWMSSARSARWVMRLTLIVPLAFCLAVLVDNSRTCIKKEQWTTSSVVKFGSMGVFTGCLAGLVGIGGGLIFSPFLLLMGVEPMVAVATSSTCVIFTSSSTTLQYLFTDRIILSLTFLYGLLNLIASYFGTMFVHLLQEHFATRRSFITGIVALGVLISAVMSCLKLAQGLGRAAF